MKNLFSFNKLGLVIITSAGIFFYFAIASAQIENIKFPVEELGGCTSKENCHKYCELPGNMQTCLNFAEKNGLMSKEELSEARKFIAAGGKGPGGCTSKESCESYCNDGGNIRECVSFAEKNGLMSQEELVEARKIVKALDSGAKLPGGCRNKQECEAYCSGGNPNNMKECIEFARTAGLMSEREIEESEKILKALDKGIAPPKCRGDEECAVYCSEPEHIEECVAFATAAGFMTEDQAQMMRKTGGKGPGGCIGRECETFCNDPANQEACFNWAKESGQIETDQNYQQMIEGRDRFKNEYGRMPTEVQQCLKENLGSDLDKMLSGNQPSPEAMSKMQTCFKQFFGQPAEQSGFAPMPREGFMPPQGEHYGPPPGYNGQDPQQGEPVPGYEQTGQAPQGYNQYQGQYGQPQGYDQYQGQYGPTGHVDGQPLPEGFYPPQPTPTPESQPVSFSFRRGVATMLLPILYLIQ